MRQTYPWQISFFQSAPEDLWDNLALLGSHLASYPRHFTVISFFLCNSPTKHNTVQWG